MKYKPIFHKLDYLNPAFIKMSDVIVYWPSASARFHRVAVERRVSQGKIVGVGAEQFREDRLSLKPTHVFINVAIHESIHERRMRVHVDVEINLSFLQDIRK